MRPEHWLFTIPLRLRSLFRRRQADQELDDELRDHVERKTEEYLAKGLAPEEARRRALLEMGGVEKRKEECRDTRRVNWIQVQDLRFGLRMLRKSLGFTVVALLTLALGIGANTALFTIVNSVLLNPLPYPQPNQLVAIYQKTAQFQAAGVTYPNFLDWQKQNRSFSLLGTYTEHDFNLTGAVEPEKLRSQMISACFFSLLGVKPLLGRTFRPEEDRPGGNDVVLLAEGLWKRRFASSPRHSGPQPHSVRQRIHGCGCGARRRSVFQTFGCSCSHRSLGRPLLARSPHERGHKRDWPSHARAHLATSASKGLSRARRNRWQIIFPVFHAVLRAPLQKLLCF
jgi:MacB-like periplasmic core domain